MNTSAPIRVVIADDESLVLSLIQAELESVGIQVIGKASDGRQAIELVRRLRPDVALLDISMPEVDGILAAATIQIDCPTPVVILSAHETKDDIGQASAAGVGAYLVKPPQASDLVRAINISIARHADLTQLRQLNDELRTALAEIKTLHGLLPICCSCKKIRDDQGYWNQVESYLAQHAGMKFTHGYCPDCLEKFFPGTTVDSTKLA